MQAIVKIANRQRGMFAARTENGEFVIIELLCADEPNIGDIVSHSDFTSMGGQDYRNVTQQITISVYVQNLVGNEAMAKKQCFLSP